MVPALVVSRLTTSIDVGGQELRAVAGVDLRIDAGETLCLVGESGCGKSMTGLSIMGLVPPRARIASGSIRLAGRELVGLSEPAMCRVRGNDVAMIFQDSITSLNPAKTIGYQVAEPLRKHRKLSRGDAREQAVEALARAGVPHPRERIANYPHELSGGLRQRVMIAMALACEPKVLIADEPTTALDVTIQDQILALIDDLKSRLGTAVLLITHDMGVVARSADRVNVMYAGHIVESAATVELFDRSRHPYTRGLLASVPRLDHDRGLTLATIPGAPPDLREPARGCVFADRCIAADLTCRTAHPPTTGTDDHQFACYHPVTAATPLPQLPPAPAAVTESTGAAVLEIRSVVKEFRSRRSRSVGRRAVQALSTVSLRVLPGETVGLVGESGSGKTTLANLAVGLMTPTGGEVEVDGEQIFSLPHRLLRQRRRDVQIMFQDTYSALDPRMRVGAILREPLRLQHQGDRREQDEMIRAALDEVGLPHTAVDRYPHEFSGGQRQRLGLARALILRPRLIVADEPVSALDVSIRSQVLNLMRRVQAAHGLSYFVISHDLTVIRYLADRVGVLYLGKLVELAPSEKLYAEPAHPYTASLLKAIPVPDPHVERRKADVAVRGEIPSALRPPSGCRFRTRCPRATSLCADEEPPLREFGDGQLAACHHPLHEPERVSA